MSSDSSYPTVKMEYLPHKNYHWHVDFKPAFMIKPGHFIHGEKFYVIEGALKMIRDYYNWITYDSSPTTVKEVET